MTDTKDKSKKTSWLKGLQSEFRKVVWPDKKTLIKQTVAVVSATVVLGVFISIVDAILKYGIDFLVK